MPTVLREGPYRFYWYSHEPGEPPHVHVDQDQRSAKFWLDAVGLARNIGFPAHELRRIRSIIEDNQSTIWRPGMGTLALNADERVASVEFSDDFLVVGLMDGRQISVPLEWYPRLAGASSGALSNWEICGGGYGLHWPELDEDLSTEGLLRGAPAPHKSFNTDTSGAGAG